MKIQEAWGTARGIKRSRDSEVDDILASGTGKKIKPTVPCKTIELIDIDADEEVDAVDLDKYVSRPIVLE